MKSVSTTKNVSDEMYSLLSAVSLAMRLNRVPYVAKAKITSGLGFREATLKACESKGLLTASHVEGRGVMYSVTPAGEAVLDDPDGSV